MTPNIRIPFIIIVVALVAGILFVMSTKIGMDIFDRMTTTVFQDAEIEQKGGIRMVTAKDIPNADKGFDFSAEIPEGWNAEYVSGSRAINIYDPAMDGNSNLEKSQILVTYFTAPDFLTLSTVNIIERKQLVIHGRPAVSYVIEKKPTVPAFTSQPSWRNVRHTVTDIRSTDAVRSTFYVFAKNPALSPEIFQNMLESVRFGSSAGTSKSVLVEPMEDFAKRVNKKPFGIFITPDNSPTQPERFRGYHTGVDAEIYPGEENANIFVRAAAAGTVAFVQEASGYGGVVVIKHAIAGKEVYGVYGHLRRSSIILNVRDAVKAGDVIGTLGAGGTPETDGERKHLHFGMYQGEVPDVRGYVQTKEELKNWLNPLDFF